MAKAYSNDLRRKRTGQVERFEQRHGSESKVTAGVDRQLGSWVRQQPDLTLEELQERLWKTVRLRVTGPALFVSSGKRENPLEEEDRSC